jgi:hypothetical protein
MGVSLPLGRAFAASPRNVPLSLHPAVGFTLDPSRYVVGQKQIRHGSQIRASGGMKN